MWWVDVLNPDRRVRDNFQEFRLVWMVCPVGAMHRELPGSAIPELEDVKRIRESSRTPPPREAFRISECVEHGVWCGSKLPRMAKGRHRRHRSIVIRDECLGDSVLVMCLANRFDLLEVIDVVSCEVHRHVADRFHAALGMDPV